MTIKTYTYKGFRIEARKVRTVPYGTVHTYYYLHGADGKLLPPLWQTAGSLASSKLRIDSYLRETK